MVCDLREGAGGGMMMTSTKTPREGENRRNDDHGEDHLHDRDPLRRGRHHAEGAAQVPPLRPLRHREGRQGGSLLARLHRDAAEVAQEELRRMGRRRRREALRREDREGRRGRGDRG